MNLRRYRRIGLICFLLTCLLWAGALPLHCAPLAAFVAGATFLAGGLFGLFLSLVTRTRRPVQIYFLLGLACMALWPLYRAWPYADAWDVIPWHGAPVFVSAYFTLLRPCAFLLGLPYPFAAVGQHGPDPLPVISMQTISTQPVRTQNDRSPGEDALPAAGPQITITQNDSQKAETEP